ncbi:MAG: NAD(P)H-dependent glycerol-3-phosphate dehydrogenase [Clostridiales bacterium]|nr:NAD(P)H-dependent glycerol-3-phosphate dehydrogenase [Clostridiales bacterium]
MSNKKSIGILGSGTWGVALARLLQRNGHHVTVWSKFQQEVDSLHKTRAHPNLPGLSISEDIVFTSDVQTACTGKDILLFAVPSVFVRSTAALAAAFIPDGQIIVDVAKGIEPDSLLTMTEVIRNELCKDGRHDNVKLVALSGPTHAEEVALDMPTAIVSACTDMDVAEVVQDTFMDTCMRTYTNADVLGVELCGALKNIMALAAGISAGLGNGDNAKALLITRGMAEIVRLGLAMGCSEQTFYGLAGIGDLIVTATSMHSRNNRCGMLIGQGKTPEEAIREVGMVVEGINALPAAMQLAERYQVEMPIVAGVNAVVTGKITPAELGHALMTRDKTREVKQSEMNVRFESALQRRRMHGETRRVLVGGTFPMLTAEEIAWLKAAKERGTWLAVALVDDGDAVKFESRRESLRALRCVDRVLPVSDWTDLKDAVHNLRIDLIVAKPEQVQQFADQEGLGVEVIIN